MRLIDANALTEVIANNVYPVVDDFNSQDYGMFWTGGIEKAIEEAPTIEPEPKWTPCSERLPEGGEEVLGTDDKGSVRMVFMTSNFKTGVHCFVTVEEGMLIDIVAWMPLPEPYKGGE